VSFVIGLLHQKPGKNAQGRPQTTTVLMDGDLEKLNVLKRVMREDSYSGVIRKLIRTAYAQLRKGDVK